MSLSILIPTLTERKHFLDRLLKVITPQCDQYGATILIKEDNREMSIGAKRNELLAAVKTPYCTFIDDDDTVASNYVHEAYEGIKKGVDVISFKGIITSDGGKPEHFIHKLGLGYETKRGINGNVYLRPPNHLNPMKIEIARQIGFIDSSWGEDKDFAERLAEAKLLKTEYYVDQYLYYYQYRKKK